LEFVEIFIEAEKKFLETQPLDLTPAPNEGGVGMPNFVGGIFLCNTRRHETGHILIFEPSLAEEMGDGLSRRGRRPRSEKQHRLQNRAILLF